MKTAAIALTAALISSTVIGATPMPDFTPAFPTGAPNDAYAQYFKGQSYLARLTDHADQTGGLYQERGKPARHLKPGDVVEIPADTDHWHGATADRWFAHLSVECHPKTNKNTWLEPVSDADYAAAQPRAAQPKLLTPREVALARISGRAAAGDMPGLKRACAEGLAAGLTVNEIKEVFVQLYAYLGFPRCLNANAAFSQLLAERKAAGTIDPEGPAPKTLPADADRERIGREKRAALFEHLFCDVFARGLLTDKERELCTVSMLCVLPGAEAQLAGHRGAAEHVGNTKAALDEAVDLARAIR